MGRNLIQNKINSPHFKRGYCSFDFLRRFVDDAHRVVVAADVRPSNFSTTKFPFSVEQDISGLLGGDDNHQVTVLAPLILIISPR